MEKFGRWRGLRMCLRRLFFLLGKTHAELVLERGWLMFTRCSMRDKPKHANEKAALLIMFLVRIASSMCT